MHGDSFGLFDNPCLWGCHRLGRSKLADRSGRGADVHILLCYYFSLLFHVFSFREKRIHPCFHVVLIEIHPQALKATGEVQGGGGGGRGLISSPRFGALGWGPGPLGAPVRKKPLGSHEMGGECCL